MRLPIKLLGLGLAVVLMPGAAHAQGPTNDPEAGSPSGTIYEIPLDDGRKDAAPRTAGSRKGDDRSSAGGTVGAGGGGGGTTGTGGSPIHSENNFGSSSTVPGTNPAGGAAAGSSTGSSGGASGNERDRNRLDQKKSDAERDVAERRADDLTTAQERAARANMATVAAPGPSMTRAVLLIGLGIVVAAGLGVAAARHAAGRR